MPRSSWYLDHRLWVEGFVLVNLAFLTPDIYLAHEENSFRRAPSTSPWSFRWSPRSCSWPASWP